MSFSVTNGWDWVFLTAAVVWVPFALVIAGRFRSGEITPPALCKAGFGLILLGPLVILLSHFLHMRDNPGLFVGYMLQFVGALLCIPWGRELGKRRRGTRDQNRGNR